MSIEQSLLGKDTSYPNQYQPDILFLLHARSLALTMPI